MNDDTPGHKGPMNGNRAAAPHNGRPGPEGVEDAEAVHLAER